jgi:hypothetical protein
MAVSRQQIVETLRRVGMNAAAAAALATLPDQIDDKDAQRFRAENGVPSMGSLTDRMGGSP